MFSNSDIAQIKEKGLSVEDINKQLDIFINGVKPTRLYRNVASPNDVIKTDDEAKPLNSKYKIESFIPASGAATRMFDSLYKTLDKINNVGEENFVLEENNDLQSSYTFFKEITKFAFFDELRECMAKDKLDITNFLIAKRYKTILEYLLTDKGLNYGSKPKALITFHKENRRLTCAFEEHISEAANYTTGKNVFLHFTLSPEHIGEFEEKVSEKIKFYEEKFDKKIHVTTSIQLPSTDTIAVNPDNTLFRNSDNCLLFRPSGHGALIHNLNALDADFIMIKNIDNVVPDSKKEVIINNRQKTLNYFTLLCDTKNYLFKVIETLKRKDSDTDLTAIEVKFLNIFKIILPSNYASETYKEKLNILHQLIDRPIRICAMVRNEGEPGGGPFVTCKNNKLSMQIVEKSQIDTCNSEQLEILETSQYFNPVDIICCIKNSSGGKYDLRNYIDHEASFISNKTKDGKPLKALELPGLWNGSMSDWITIFVEVPIDTFNPVKTVNDLLRPAHS